MSAPAVVLESVVARDGSGARGAPRGSLTGASLELGPGVVAILGAPEDGSIALFEVLTGRRRPELGNVRIGGRDPARDPSARRRIGAVGLTPALPAAPSVAAAIEIARSAAGSSVGARAVLDKAGLGALADRKPETLTSAEARAVELALALAVEAPLLLVVHEPFSDMARPGGETLAALEAAGKDAPVIVLTSSPADARRSERLLVLARGVVARESNGGHAALGAPPACHLVAWVGAGARELASVLAARAEVASLILSADAPGGLAVVRLAGTDMDMLASAFAEAAVASGADVQALREMAPVSAEVTAMTEWEVRARQLTAMHLAASDARLRSELAAADAAARAAAYAARGYAAGQQPPASHAAELAPAWGPAAPQETSPGVLAPVEPPPVEPPPVEPPQSSDPSGGAK